MTTCQACATPLPKGSRFCYACGSQVPGVGESASAAETPGRAEEFLRKLRARLGEEYDVEREIGRGGMGIVYLAREKALDRHVALKVLPSVLAFDESIVARFIREARLAARLDHPNIVPIHRVGQAGDITYFALKYVTGGSLQGLLKNTPQLPIAEAQRILAACAHALGYAHARGIVHRDVKPANILLDTGGRVYVTDLGIAKAMAAEASLTASGAVVGTPMYMPPEQCRGEQADARSDQYSLGIVGYQMLAGRLPFEGGKSMEGILYDRLFTDPEPLESHRPEAPAVLRDAIHRAMSREPQDRFPTMEEFAAAVMGDAPGAEVLTTTPAGATVRYTPGGVPTPATGARRAAAVSSRGGAAAPPAPPAPLAPAESRRRRTAVWVAALAAVLVIAGASYWVWLRPQGAGSAGDARPEQMQPSEPQGGEPIATPAQATWRLAVALPEGATLTLDGAATSGAQGELQPGAHTARVAAAGNEPWEETRTLAAGATWEIRPVLTAIREPAGRAAGRREPPAQKEEPRPAPEEAPEVLLEAIRGYLQQGAEAHTAGRYLEAAERYRRGLQSVVEAERLYRRDGALARLRRQLQDALKKSIEACTLERQPNCPKP